MERYLGEVVKIIHVVDGKRILIYIILSKCMIIFETSSGRPQHYINTFYSLYTKHLSDNIHFFNSHFRSQI